MSDQPAPRPQPNPAPTDTEKPQLQQPPPTSQPATEAPKPPKPKKWLIPALIVITIILITTIGFLIYQNNLLNQQISQSPSPKPNAEPIETYGNGDPLSSLNIDEVIKEIASHHIPYESIDIELGNSMFRLQFYKTILDNNQYKKLNSFLGFTTFPSYQELTLSNSSWNAYSHSEASAIFTKNGYLCILFMPNKFNVPLSFSCTQAGNFKDSSLEKVSNFIQETLSEARVACLGGNCQTEQSEESIPLPMYTRSLLFFENTESSNSSQQLTDVDKELSLVTQLFENSNWNANIEDYTSIERKWAKNTLTSQRVTAKNNLFECVYTVTIDNYANNKNKRIKIDCSYTLEALTEKQEEINKTLQL